MPTNSITYHEVTNYLGAPEEGKYRCPVCELFHLVVKDGRNGAQVHCFTEGCPKRAAWKKIQEALRPHVLQAKAKDFAPLEAHTNDALDDKKWPGLTLADFAKQKCIPEGLLKLFGVHERTINSDKFTGGREVPAVCFPYGFWQDGKWVLTSVKVRGGSSHQTFWDHRTPDGQYIPVPFGLSFSLYRPDLYGNCADLFIVEGESDAITLALSGFPALGCSGANGLDDAFASVPAIQAAECVVITEEPGKDGAKFARTVAEGLRNKKEVYLLPFPDTFKDPSELYVKCMAEAKPEDGIPPRPDGFDDEQYANYVVDGLTLGLWSLNPGKDLFRARIQEMFEKSAQRYFRSTDMGNAERLVAAHGKSFRYLKDEGIFVVWDGRVWKRDKSEKSRGEGLLPVVKKIIREAPYWHDTDWQKSSESHGKQHTMIDSTKGETEVLAENTDFDKHPMLLYVQNGVVDLTTGALREFCREDYVTRAAAVSYDASAKCPKFLAFLDLIFQGDADTIRFIQKALGYSLTGSIGEQCFFLCYGLGANGKSTLLEIMAQMLGPDFYAPAKFTTFISSKQADAKYELADFRGKRLLTAVEPRKAGHLDEEVLKQMTGGDLVKVRQIYERNVDYYPEFKLWFAMNSKPRILGTDEGIWRRVRFLPFSVRIPEDRKIKEFHKILFAEEGPGILNWLVEGCLSWQKEGLEMSGAVKRATDEFRAEQNAFQRFIERCCIEGKKTYHAKAGGLYEAYKKDCEENDEFQLRQNEFSEELERRGYQKKRAHEGYHWWGVTLKGSKLEDDPKLDFDQEGGDGC